MDNFKLNKISMDNFIHSNFSPRKDGVFFVDRGGCATVLRQQAFRQGARLRLALFRPPPRNPVRPRDLVQQGRTFAPFFSTLDHPRLPLSSPSNSADRRRRMARGLRGSPGDRIHLSLRFAVTILPSPLVPFSILESF